MTTITKYSEYRCRRDYLTDAKYPYYIEGKDSKGEWNFRFAVNSYDQGKYFTDNPELIEIEHNRIVKKGLIGLGCVIVFFIIWFIYMNLKSL